MFGSGNTLRSLAAAVPALIFALSPLAHAGGEGWVSDFAAAKATAVKENKDLLMDFTGSDWCSWCIRLNKEVFNKDAFKQDAPKHFVLVELDYPQQKELPEELTKQNAELQEKFQIQGFPTIILADSSGRPYAQTGYQDGGPEKYNEMLAGLRKKREERDAAWKKAESATGLEKAKAIHEGLKALPDDLIPVFYQAEVDQVIALDTDDTLGLKAKLAVKERRDKLEETLASLANDEKFDEFEAAIDKFIADEKLTGSGKQEVMMMKLQTYGPDKIDKADALMDEVIKADEKSDLAEQARSIKERIIEMRKDIEKSKNPDAKDDNEDPVVPEPAEEK